MPTRPSGTVTFLFTDIEGSTRLWDEQPEAMGGALSALTTGSSKRQLPIPQDQTVANADVNRSTT